MARTHAVDTIIKFIILSLFKINMLNLRENIALAAS